MTGSMKSSDEIQEKVDRYAVEVGLYEERKHLGFNLRAYAR